MSRFAVALLIAGLLAACAPSAMIRIHHPARTGSVEPNRVVIAYAQVEGYYALPPGSLADEAALVSFEPAGACFQVHLRNLAEDGQLSSVQAYSITLEADDQPLPAPTVTPEGLVSRQYQGQVPQQQQTGTSTTCVSTNSTTGQCERWDTQPTYSTVFVPGVITVVEGGGIVCFQNNGALNPQTREIALEFRGATGVAHRFVFEWEFIDPFPPVEQAAPTARVAAN